MISFPRGILIAFATLTVLFGCNRQRTHIGEPRVETQSVKLGAAKTVGVELKLGAGDLKVRGGAADLMESTFSYSVPTWKPKMGYRVSGGRGALTIEEPGGTHTNLGDTRSSWDLRFNNNVPTEIHLEMGAGDADLAMGELSLTGLRVEMGAGTSTVDLTGNWKHDVDAHIEGGLGQLTIKLPRNMGARVAVEGGLGSVSAPGFKKDGDAYVNDEYGKSSATVRVRVEGGLGKVNLELGGGQTL